MESLLPPAKHVLQLPPLEARITPPPEEMNPASPQKIPCPVYSPQLPQTVSEPVTLPSDATSTASAGSSTKTGGRRSTSASSRPRVDGRRASHNSNIVFSPRPYETLYTERAYLLTSLQMQSAKTANLLNQYTSIEDSLRNGETGKDMRRLRKRLSHIRSKVNEAVEQEMAIFTRLNELYVEIRSRETWTQANHRKMCSQGSLDPGTPTSYATMSPISFGMSSPITPLNAATPDFVPIGHGYFPESSQSAEMPQSPYAGNYGVPHLETVDEAAEEAPAVSNDAKESEKVEEDEVSITRRASCDDSVSSGRDRRFSLPCPKFVWPEA